MPSTPTTHPWIKRIAIALLLALLGIIAGALLSQSPQQPGTDRKTASLQPPRALQAFQLTHQGKTQLDNNDLRGRWTWLFFGYSHCPDICPTTLAELARTYSLLEDIPGALDDVQFIFVSVDPARDTPARLADYAGYFNPAFIGVTGEPAQLTALASQLDVQFRLGNENNPQENYSVDHSSAVLLIDPQVRYHARFNAPHRASHIRKQFLDIRQHYDELAP